MLNQTTESEQIGSALRVLEQFKDAAINLMESWHPCLERGYPFNESFTDWVGEHLLNWVDEANLRYPCWLELIAIQLKSKANLIGSVAAVYKGTKLNIAYASFDLDDLGQDWSIVSRMRIGWI